MVKYILTIWNGLVAGMLFSRALSAAETGFAIKAFVLFFLAVGLLVLPIINLIERIEPN